MCGTIARKKKSLDILMDTILKVCQKKIVPTPKKVVYSSIVEEGIKELEIKLKSFSNLPKYLYRWIALKIIDGEEKILESIEKNLSISINDNVDFRLIRIKIINNLKTHKLSTENFKDCIVSSIIKRCEKICKKVCSFENKNYSR